MNFVLIYSYSFVVAVCLFLVWRSMRLKAQKEKKGKQQQVASSSLGHDCRFEVKGIYYRTKEEQNRARHVRKGEGLRLKREPDNKYDSNAIKIVTLDNVHIGYVPREYAVRLAPIADSLKSCRVELVLNEGDGLRIKIRVSQDADTWYEKSVFLLSPAVQWEYEKKHADIREAIASERMNPEVCLNVWRNCLKAHPNDLFVEYHYMLALGYAHRSTEAADYATDFKRRHHLERWNDLVDFESYWRKKAMEEAECLSRGKCEETKT